MVSVRGLGLDKQAVAVKVSVAELGEAAMLAVKALDKVSGRVSGRASGKDVAREVVFKVLVAVSFV